MNTRIALRLTLMAALCATALLMLVAAASGHSDGCHSAHSCPSDHHSYVWYDGSGAGYDCVQPGAPEYDPSRDTIAISYAGRTYYCRAAGSAPPPAAAPDSDQDGIPDAQDACPTQAGPGPSGCPAPADSDGDGKPDSSDACPTQAATTSNGCPVAKPPPPLVSCKINGPYPDRHCTPGKTFTVSTKTVCKVGYSKAVRNVSSTTKNRVFARYGITSYNGSTYEFDHFIPLELGGSNALSNLFPEAASPVPGFHQKDRLENALHRRVCAGRMTLKAAQVAIRKDWVAAYKRYATP